MAIIVPFTILVFLLAVPFWLAAELFQRKLLPGLPISALMVICPAVAASMLAPQGAGRLLRSAFDHLPLSSLVWLGPIFLLIPSLAVASYYILGWLGASPPPFHAQPLATAVMAAAFFLAALIEELGWSGYAAVRLQGHLGLLWMGTLLGIIWAIWHILPYFQADRSWPWIVWQCLFTIAFRILLVWIYAWTGPNIFAVALCHASANMSAFLFPTLGSHYSPSLMFGLTLSVAGLVLTIWPPPPGENECSHR